MASLRTLGAAALAAVLLAAAGGAALADPPPWAHGHHRRSEFESAAPQPPSHGVISGTIAGVDYGGASILVATPHGVVPFTVTPTTNITRDSGFASFADLARGAHVTVDFSEAGGRLIAQIIRIR